MIKFTGTLPEYQTTDSTGADICTTEDFTISPGEIKIVPTGLFIEEVTGVPLYKFDFGTWRGGVEGILDIQIRPRSGLAAKHGVTVLNTPGSLDTDYRQEIKVILISHGKGAVEFKAGDRIAQMVVALALRVPQFEVKQVTRTGGFGSSGQ